MVMRDIKIPDKSGRKLGVAYARLRLKHLQLIEALGRTGSISQAGEEMQLTQSAATKVLQDAEEIFDAVLFSRHPRGLVATAVGHQLIRYAQQFLNETGRVLADVGSLKRGGAGSISIGAIMATMPSVLPKALAELRRRKPLLTVHLTATTSDEILTMLEQRKLEIGVCRLTHPSQKAIFNFEQLFDEVYWIFVGKGHPVAGSSHISLVDLVQLPWVLQPLPAPSRQVLETAFAIAGVLTPSSLVETTSRFATLNLVKHAGMIGMLPSTILSEGVEHGEFVRLPIKELKPPTKYGLVTRRGEPLSDHVADLAAIIRSNRHHGGP
jgi:DNA-binding transcriptional LysR family regulator